MLKFSAFLVLSMLAAASALAQGVFVEPMPNVKPLPAAESKIDGRVAGLNATASDALAEIRSKGLSVTDERVAPYLQAALLKDGKIDAAEADLLNEMTQPRIRSINITREGAKPTDPVLVAITTSGTAKKLYFDTLYPASELAATVAKGEQGWKGLILSARSNDGRETQITNFLAEKFGEAWKQSNVANAYKPTTELIAQYHKWSMDAGTDADTIMAGRIIVYRAAYTADMKHDNKMPDFLYNWLKQPPKPAG